jgi:hypothetical protein
MESFISARAGSRLPHADGGVGVLTPGPTLAIRSTQQPAVSVSGRPRPVAERKRCPVRRCASAVPCSRSRAKLRSVPAASRDGVRKAVLGNECLANRCSCPSVRAVNRWNLLGVQPVGDLLQRYALPEHRVELHPPYVVTLIAEPVRKPDVVGREATSVHFESRIVVGRRHPIGTRRYRLEVPTTPEAVALGHLATHVDDLAIPDELPEDSANSPALKLLNCSFSSILRCPRDCWLRDLLFVVHARALSPRRWRPSGYGR